MLWGIVKIIIDGFKNFVAQILWENVEILGKGENNVGSIRNRGLWGIGVILERYL